MRGALAEAYGTGAWQPLTVRTVPAALPAVPPPQPLSRTARVGPRHYVCGDHRATGSVQGGPGLGGPAPATMMALNRRLAGSRSRDMRNA